VTSVTQPWASQNGHPSGTSNNLAFISMDPGVISGKLPSIWAVRSPRSLRIRSAMDGPCIFLRYVRDTRCQKAARPGNFCNVFGNPVRTTKFLQARLAPVLSENSSDVADSGLRDRRSQARAPKRARGPQGKKAPKSSAFGGSAMSCERER
jgi:hypothetical protein